MVVDVRCLVAEYPKHVTPSKFRLDFSCISNPQLRDLVKRYFRARMGFWEARTFATVLGHMKPFFSVFNRVYPEMTSFAVLSREMIEPLLTCSTWTSQHGTTRSISANQKR